MNNFQPALIETWMDVMARASFQGTVAIIVVLTISWLLTKRVSHQFQCWLWRLVFVKLLLLTILSSPLNVQILPAVDSPATKIAARKPAINYIASPAPH